jgi:hypothetical protein
MLGGHSYSLALTLYDYRHEYYPKRGITHDQPKKLYQNIIKRCQHLGNFTDTATLFRETPQLLLMTKFDGDRREFILTK